MSSPSQSTRSRPGSRHEARSASTQAKLVRAGRALFARHGYAGVSAEQIVRRAGVTRGALYHHFDGKLGLFAAVFEQVEQELTHEIAERALATATSPWQGLVAGAEAMLDASLRPEVAQIVLLDAPSVLGWEVWREVGERYGLGLVEAGLQASIESGELERQPVKPLAHLLIGALDEAVLMVARAEDRVRTRREVGAAITWLMGALRKS